MDTALVVISLLSVGLTGALLVYAARLQREQREREEARVAAPAEELRLDPEPPPVFRDAPSPDVFEAAAEPAPPAKRLAIPAISALVVAAALGGIWLAIARSRDAAAGPKAVGSSPAADGALELVRLEQAKKGEALTVRGVVSNPHGKAERRGVAAVGLVFDRSGALAASARAAVDFRVLEAGDESPFTVTVPGAATGARYRVSVRADRHVVPHVDRRVAARAGRGHLGAGGRRGEAGALSQDLRGSRT